MKLFGLEPESFSRLILSIGSHRGVRPFTPVEVAEHFKTMIDNGASLDACAEAVHLDGTAMISRFLRLNQLHDSVKYLVDWGASKASLGFTAAHEIARIPQSTHEEIVKKILRFGLKSNEVRQIAQLHIRSGRAVSECTDEVIGMRPQIEVRHVVIGSITQEAIIQRLKGLSQTQRNLLFAKALRVLFGKTIEVTGGLSPNRFTIAGDQGFSKAFQRLGGDFEEIITEKLAAIPYE